jgi:hypothetical protein
MPTETTKQWVDRKGVEAINRYHTHYDNDLYVAAIEGHDTDYANQLTDAALAICGDPRFRVEMYDWDAKAEAFLSRFK